VEKIKVIYFLVVKCLGVYKIGVEGG